MISISVKPQKVWVVHLLIYSTNIYWVHTLYQLLKRLQFKNSLNRSKMACTDSARIQDVYPGVPVSGETTVNCRLLLLWLEESMGHWAGWKVPQGEHLPESLGS